MNITIQKHRVHPIWKLYDESRKYLGQILGETKEGMPALAITMADILSGKELPEFKKEVLSDGSINIYNAENKRVGAFEKEFKLIANALRWQGQS